MEERHRVVIVGAGFGGLAAAKGLARAPVDVVLIDAENYHLFQPLLYQVATAGLGADDIAFPIRGIFHRQRNLHFVLGQVLAADLDAKSLDVAGVGTVPFDTLVLAAGATTATFGVAGVAEHAFALKHLPDALRLRNHVLGRFEEVAAAPELADDGALTVVIVGGGPTGVELAGGLVELFRVLAKDFPRLDAAKARVVIVEAADRLLGGFAPRLSGKALKTLTRRGVEVRLGVAVDKVEPSAVHLAGGERIAAHTVVWAAGVEATPLVSMLGVPFGRAGRVTVAADLSVTGHPHVYAVGDAAASPAARGGVLPQLAPVAIQGGRHVARQIIARLEGRPGAPFRYLDKGTMATIGRNSGIAELPFGIKLWGWPGWVAWLGLHLFLLMGFRNRANVVVNWAWSYLTYDRGSRLIID